MVGLMAGGTGPGPAIALTPNAEADRDFTFTDAAALVAPAAGGAILPVNDLFAWIWAQARAEFTLTAAGV